MNKRTDGPTKKFLIESRSAQLKIDSAQKTKIKAYHRAVFSLKQKLTDVYNSYIQHSIIWDLGLEAGIWASRLRNGPLGWGEEGAEEKKEKERP